MIQIIELPQFSENYYTYEVVGDVLNIYMDGSQEELDLTMLTDGFSEGVEMDNIPVNPIVSIAKENGVITVTLVRFYGEDEKERFEDGYNTLEV